jgi:ankyrin repeat protein
MGGTLLATLAGNGNAAGVRQLLERGSPVDPADAKGRSPLALASKACVDSFWAYRRTPESVEALLRAGASVRGAGVRFPSGYAEVDDLLRRYGA